MKELQIVDNAIEGATKEGCITQTEYDAWQTLKAAVLAQQSTNSAIMKLLNDMRLLLLDVDTPTREQRADIIHRIAQLSQ